MTAPALPKMSLPQRTGTAAARVMFETADHVAQPAPEGAAVEVLVAELVLDDRIQPREKIDPAKVLEYADLLTDARDEGRDLLRVFKDPIEVYVDPETGTKYVAGGFHRTLSARKAQVPTLLAIVRPGGIYEARLWASGTNHGNGLPRSEGDRRRVLHWYLDDPSGTVRLTPEVIERLPPAARRSIQPGVPVALSDHLIADLCKVSQSTVTRRRQKMREERAGAGSTDAAHQLHLDEVAAAPRLGADGRARRPPVRTATPVAAALPCVTTAAAAKDLGVTLTPEMGAFRAFDPPAGTAPRATARQASPAPPATDATALRLRAWEDLSAWGERIKAAGLSDTDAIHLLARLLFTRTSSTSLPAVTRRFLQRLAFAAADEVLLPPAEEGALHFALHRHEAPWAELQQSGADDGELLRAIQAGFGQHGEHTGQTLRVSWRGGKSPELRIFRIGSSEPHALLQGHDLLRATRALMKIPSARGGRAER